MILLYVSLSLDTLKLRVVFGDTLSATVLIAGFVLTLKFDGSRASWVDVTGGSASDLPIKHVKFER